MDLSLSVERSRIVGDASALNACAAAALGSGFGQIIGAGNVVVTGRDGKGFSRLLKRAMTCGIMENGVEVLDTRLVPRSVTRYCVSDTSSDFGVYVGFDWRRPGTLAVAFFDGKGALLGQGMLEEILKKMGCLERTASAREVGDIVFFSDAGPRYEAEILKAVDVKAISAARPKVMLDCSNGAVSVTLPQILRKLDCQIVASHDNPAAYLGSRPVLADESLMADFARKVKEAGASLGIALDPCGESARFVDDEGSVLSQRDLGRLLVENAGVKRMGVRRELAPEFPAGRVGVKVLEDDDLALPSELDVALGHDDACYLRGGQKRWWDALPVALKLVEIVSKGKRISQLRRAAAQVR